LPAAENCDVVVPPPTSTSVVHPVDADPLAADFDDPTAEAATSNGAVGSSPPYSTMRTSGIDTDALNVTVTWFAPGPAAATFAA
jgi:hypothetical protein